MFFFNSAHNFKMKNSPKNFYFKFNSRSKLLTGRTNEIIGGYLFVCLSECKCLAATVCFPNNIFLSFCLSVYLCIFSSVYLSMCVFVRLTLVFLCNCIVRLNVCVLHFACPSILCLPTCPANFRSYL